MVLAGVASDAEDLLSRLIGMRLPGASLVTRWGLFSRRGGNVEGSTVAVEATHSLLSFVFLLKLWGFMGSSLSLLVDAGASTETVVRSPNDEDNIRVKH